MKKTAKVMAFALAASIATAGLVMPASAIYDPNGNYPTDGVHVLIMPVVDMPYDPENPAPDGTVHGEIPQRTPALVVNNEVVETKVKPYRLEDGTWMIPVRAVAEALGLTVTYRPDVQGADISKDNQHTTIYFGQNSYFFNRVAPFELEAAPVVFAGTSYVPLSFFERVLKQPVAVSGTEIVIGEDTRPVAVTAAPGEEFTITLEENASTGFTWGYIADPAEGLTEVSNEFIEPDIDVVGAAGSRQFVFKAEEAGSFTLTFQYARTFEETGEPALTRVFEVRIAEAEMPPLDGGTGGIDQPQIEDMMAE